MGAGTLTMACLWTLLGQVASPATPIPSQLTSDVFPMNQRAFSFPINFKDARRNELREILLFVSRDQGRTWQQEAAVLPDKNGIPFNAPIDGIYWFRVAAVNLQGKQEPDNIQQGPPDQKILIDSIKPNIKTLTAQRQGDEVALNWEIQEDYPDWQNFRLEYQAKDNSGAFWAAIPATPSLVGQTKFRPSSSGPLVIRLVAQDLAKNVTMTTTEVGGAVSTAGFSANSSPVSAPSNNVVPAVVPPPVAPPPVAPPPQGMPPVVPPPVAPPMGIRAAPPPPPEPVVNKVMPQQQQNPAWNPGQPPVDSNTKLIAGTPELNSGTPASGVMSYPAAGNRRPLPALQYVNHPEVVLEYELTKIGPSGVGTVDLWWTRDDGLSWERYAEDPTVQGTTQNGRHQRTVELPGDGVYGFILVVKSRAGMGKLPPRAGDTPEIRVEVDTSPPVAQLFSPSPDPQRPNALTLKWAAKDNNLTNMPVTLEWAENREGPWQPIAINIPNNGRHTWQLPDRLPVQVYMRLRVRDLAGNESIAVTAEPQLVDLSEPEGRLVNVSVTPRRP